MSGSTEPVAQTQRRATPSEGLSSDVPYVKQRKGSLRPSDEIVELNRQSLENPSTRISAGTGALNEPIPQTHVVPPTSETAWTDVPLAEQRQGTPRPSIQMLVLRRPSSQRSLIRSSTDMSGSSKPIAQMLRRPTHSGRSSSDVSHVEQRKRTSRQSDEIVKLKRQSLEPPSTRISSDMGRPSESIPQVLPRPPPSGQSWTDIPMTEKPKGTPKSLKETVVLLKQSLEPARISADMGDSGAPVTQVLLRSTPEKSWGDIPLAEQRRETPIPLQDTGVSKQQNINTESSRTFTDVNRSSDATTQLSPKGELSKHIQLLSTSGTPMPTEDTTAMNGVQRPSPHISKDVGEGSATSSQLLPDGTPQLGSESKYPTTVPTSSSWTDVPLECQRKGTPIPSELLKFKKRGIRSTPTLMSGSNVSSSSKKASGDRGSSARGRGSGVRRARGGGSRGLAPGSKRHSGADSTARSGPGSEGRRFNLPGRSNDDTSGKFSAELRLGLSTVSGQDASIGAKTTDKNSVGTGGHRSVVKSQNMALGGAAAARGSDTGSGAGPCSHFVAVGGHRGSLEQQIPSSKVLLPESSGEIVFEPFDGSFEDRRGLRFSPSELIFREFFEGERRAISFCLKNVSSHPLKVAVHEPQSMFFTLELPGFDDILAPGLCHQNKLVLQVYSWHTDNIADSYLAVFVDGFSETYNIKTQYASPLFEIKPAGIDFGLVNLGAPLGGRTLTLRNKGSLVGTFVVDVGSHAHSEKEKSLPITVHPIRGKLHAQKEIQLKVKITPPTVGEFTRNFWVRCAPMALYVPVKVQVVSPRLELRYPRSHDATLSSLTARSRSGVSSVHHFIGAGAIGVDPAANTSRGTRRTSSSCPSACHGTAVGTPSAPSSAPSTGRLMTRSSGHVPERTNQDATRVPRGIGATVQKAAPVITTTAALSTLPALAPARVSFATSNVVPPILHLTVPTQTKIPPQVGTDRSESVFCDSDEIHGAFALLDFGTSYFGTQDRRVAVVRNASAEVCTFVILAELSSGKVMTLQDARELEPELRVFRAHPEEGRMESFETRIFTFGFEPHLWVDEEEGRRANEKRDFVLFIRLVRVRCTDFSLASLEEERLQKKTRSNFMTSGWKHHGARRRSRGRACAARSSEPNCASARDPPSAPGGRPRSPPRERDVRVCLHGEALPLQLRLRPRALHLGRVARGEHAQRELRLSNDCARLPLRFRVAQPTPPGVRVAPPEAVLEPGGSLEILVQVTPLSYTNARLRLRLELLAPSLPLLGPQRARVVGARAVRVCYESAAQPPPPAPRPNPALGPCPLREVGVVGDGLPFCSAAPKPRAAVLRYDLRGRLRCGRPPSEPRVDSGVRPGDRSPCDSGAVTCCEECSPDKETTGLGKMDAVTPNESSEVAEAVMQDVLGVTLKETKSVDIKEPRTVRGGGRSDSGSGGGSSVEQWQRRPNGVHHGRKDKRRGSGKKRGPAFWTSRRPGSWTMASPRLGGNVGKGRGRNGQVPCSTEATAAAARVLQNCHAEYCPISTLLEVPSSESTSAAMVDGCSMSIGDSSDDASTPENILHSHLSAVPPSSPSSADGHLGNAASQEVTIEVFKGQCRKEATVSVFTSGTDVTNKYRQELLREDSLAHAETSTAPKTPTLSTHSEDEKDPGYTRKKQPLSHRAQLDPKQPPMPSPVGSVSSSASSQPPAPHSSLRSVSSEKHSNTKIGLRKAPKPAVAASVPEPLTTLRLIPMWEKDSPYIILNNTKQKKKTQSADDDSEEGELIGARSEPDSPGPATAMQMKRPSGRAPPTEGPSGLDTSAPELALAQKRNGRCEALRWARGEQLHAHCAFVALPNDTAQRSLRPWPSNRLTRSIFTGAPRYVAPQDSRMALAPLQLLARAARADAVRRGIRERAARTRRLTDAHSSAKPPLPDYEVCHPAKYNYLRFRPASEISASYAPVEQHPKRGDSLQSLVPLTPRQLINVRLAPPLVDFGIVGSGNLATTHVIVENGNEVPVKVNAYSSQPCVKVPGGQICVPAHDKKELTVTLDPPELGLYSGLLEYVVNGCHAFQVRVTAEVVTPTLKLHTDSLIFGFLRGREDPWPQLVHVVTVENPLQIASHFEWLAVEKTCYEVVPRLGEVPPKSVCACEVTYRANPDAQSADAALLLSTEGNNYLQLSCRLNVPVQTTSLQAGFVQQNVELPNLSLFRRRRFVTRLYNASFMDTLFKVENGGEDMVTSIRKEDTGCVGWRLRPPRGVLPARSVRLLILTLRAVRPGNVCFHLRVALGQDAFAPTTADSPRENPSQGPQLPPTIWRRMAIKTITTNVVCPNIVVNPRCVRLRRVPVGSVASAPLTFQNVGSVEATVRLVQSELLADGEWTLSLKPDCLEPVEEPLMIKAHSSPVKLFLLFRPLDVSSYDFLLPLQINGMLGPPTLGDDASLRPDSYFPGTVDDRFRGKFQRPKLPCVQVEATVSREVLNFSGTNFNFCHDPSDADANGRVHVLHVCNVVREPVMMWLPAEMPNGEPFSIQEMQRSPSPAREGQRSSIFEATKNELQYLLVQLLADRKITDATSYRDDISQDISARTSLKFEEQMLICTLDPGDFCSFEIIFQPNAPGSYSATVPVFVSCSSSNQPVRHLFLDGVYHQPTLRLLVDEIFLPPRPLNVPAEMKVWLEASHHVKQSVITWSWEKKFSEAGASVPSTCFKVVMGEQRVPPGSGVHSLCATVVFKTPRPLGLRARISFSSGPPPEGASCELEVTAMADCSLLTTHAFLRSHKQFFKAAPQTEPTGSRNLSLKAHRRTHGSRSRLTAHYETFRSDEEEDDDDDGDDWIDKSKIKIRKGTFYHTPKVQPTTSNSEFPSQPAPPPTADALSLTSLLTAQSAPEAILHLPPSTMSSVAETPHRSTMAISQSAMELGRSSLRAPNAPSSGLGVILSGCEQVSASLPGLPPTVMEPCGASTVSTGSAEASLRLPKRRRRSRCSVTTATVDADEDSLLSSEESEEDTSRTASLTLYSGTSRTNILSERKLSGSAQVNIDAPSDKFPYFPDSRDGSDQAVYMRRVQIAVQEWLYDVVYRRFYWATIPDGFNQMYRLWMVDNTLPSDNNNTELKKRKTKDPNSLYCPFDMETPFAAFTNLSGDAAREFLAKFPDCTSPTLGRSSAIFFDHTLPQTFLRSLLVSAGSEEEEAGLRDLSLATTRRLAVMLHVMRNKGAVLPHVRPEYLIDYCHYQLLYQDCKSREDTKDRNNCTSDTNDFDFPREESSKESSKGDNEHSEEEECHLSENEVKFHGQFLSKQQHRRINRQAWLDVVLQWARAYWMPKVEEEHNSAQQAVRVPEGAARASEGAALRGKASLETRRRQYSVASAARYSDQELCLLAWLNERFDRVRLSLCPHAEKPPPARTIVTFDRHLADGVVLAATTLDVCPFLRNYLRDLYPAPATIEQAKHNAARLVSAWGALRLGFTVSVRDIVHPLAVKMLLLVAHLYNVLPGVSTRHTLKLSASLATHATQALTLVNPSKLHMQYLAEFIGDPESFFSVLGGSETYTGENEKGVRTGVLFSIGPGKKVHLHVRFHARTFHKRNCTLLLTGSMLSPNFGRALALHLEGETSTFDVASTVNISSPLYQPVRRELKLSLPYSSKSLDQNDVPEFELFFLETMPTSAGGFTFRRWGQMYNRKVLHRLFLNQHIVQPPSEESEQPQNGVLFPIKVRKQKPIAHLEVTVCAFTPQTRTFCIGCVSPSAGDFVVKVVSHPSRIAPLGILDLPLPPKWRLAKCTCGGKFAEEEGLGGLHCPLVTYIQVPCRNSDLWHAAITMFEMTLDDKERAFWQEHLASSVGIQLMQWELEKDDPYFFDEYAHIFNTSVTYNVTFSHARYFGAQSELYISDVRSEGTVPLAIHVDNDVTQSMDVRLRLTSADKREVRVYLLRARAPSSPTHARMHRPRPKSTSSNAQNALQNDTRRNRETIKAETPWAQSHLLLSVKRFAHKEYEQGEIVCQQRHNYRPNERALQKREKVAVYE